MSKESFRYYFKLKDWNPTKLNIYEGLKCIQKEERDRIKKFVFKDNFKAALIGRLLIRKIINQKFNLNNNEIKLIRNKNGRPILDYEESIDDEIFNQDPRSKDANLNKNLTFDFNISHNGDYCVAIGENARGIGIDIMKIESRSDNLDKYFKLMDKKFTTNEWDFINAINSDKERMKRFLRLWTLKESFVKARGCGLTIDLKRINFKCKTAELKMNEAAIDTILEFDGKILGDWLFMEYLLDQDHCVAIAINKLNNDKISSTSSYQRLKEIKFNELIDGLDGLNDFDENVNSLWNFYSQKGERGKLT